MPLRGRHRDRRRRRRDREDAVGRGVQRRRVPRLRGRQPLPRRPTAAIADMCILGEPTEQKRRARPLRLDLGADLDRAALHPHRLHRRAAGRELDPAHARGARRVLRVDPALGADPATPTAASPASSTSARCGRLRLARLPHPAPHRPLPRHPRAARRCRWRPRAPRGARVVASSRAPSPATASRARST